MTPPAVGLGTLRRLSAMPTAGHPVLSVYLDLDRAAQCQPASCASKLDALVAVSTPTPSLRESEAARELLCGLQPLPHGARSLALFSCVEAACSAVVALPDVVEPMAALEPVPWLEPLAGLCLPGGRPVERLILTAPPEMCHRLEEPNIRSRARLPGRRLLRLQHRNRVG